MFMSDCDHKMYPEAFFETQEFIQEHCFGQDTEKVIKRIIGCPCIGERDRYWNSYYIFSETDSALYRGIESVSNFWKKHISPKFELNLQDRLETVKVKTPNGEYAYQKGEIIVECFVQLDAPGSVYRDVLNIEHTRNDLGRVVAIRVLNSEDLKEKFDFRYCTYESEWGLFKTKELD